MALLDTVKSLLRITGSPFDDEINDLIAAAQNDLRLSGVLEAKTTSDTDPLIKRAVSVYCKANFGLDNPDAAKFQASYESLKAHLTLSQEYTAYSVTFTVSVGATLLENAVVTFNGSSQITNSSGVTVFIGVDAAQNMAYTVTLTGYADVSDIVDVSGSQSVAVAMEAV